LHANQCGAAAEQSNSAQEAIHRSVLGASEQIRAVAEHHAISEGTEFLAIILGISGEVLREGI